MTREYDDYLRDMLENAEKALSFIGGLDYETFRSDDKALYAAGVYPAKRGALEIMGEAALILAAPTTRDSPCAKNGIK
jgi:uncharacterized protein with HEPN domain